MDLGGLSPVGREELRLLTGQGVSGIIRAAIRERTAIEAAGKKVSDAREAGVYAGRGFGGGGDNRAIAVDTDAVAVKGAETGNGG